LLQEEATDHSDPNWPLRSAWSTTPSPGSRHRWPRRPR